MMETVYVYADVMILISIAVSYPLLWITARENNLCFRWARALLAAGFSGIMLLIEVLVRLPYYFSFLWGIISYSVMIPVSFGKMKLKRYLFSLLFLAGSNLILSGLLTAVNGGGYQGAAGIVIGTALILIFKRIVLQHGTAKTFYRMKLVFDGKTVILEAFLDTGNMLVEPISKAPVIIVSQKYGRNADMEGRVPVYAKTAAGSRILYTVKADEAWMFGKREWHMVGDVMIGFSETSEFEAIIGPEVVPLFAERQ